MIPRADITEWRSRSPWRSDAQVEQDLMISRALVEVFGNSFLAERLAFRGGTALHKLFLSPAARYSEDIDLVQIQAGPIGSTLDRLHDVLDPWLGAPALKSTEEGVTLTYKVESEIPPITPLRLKVEINTREHISLFGMIKKEYRVATRWFDGASGITTFTIDELLGTKLRALYQRRKGRDLFDLWLGITQGKAEPARIVEAFLGYIKGEGTRITRSAMQSNLDLKMKHKSFMADIAPLLRPDIQYDPLVAYSLVSRVVIPLL